MVRSCSKRFVKLLHHFLLDFLFDDMDIFEVDCKFECYRRQLQIFPHIACSETIEGWVGLGWVGFRRFLAIWFTLGRARGRGALSGCHLRLVLWPHY